MILCIIYNQFNERESWEWVSSQKKARRWFENAFIKPREVEKSGNVWTYHAK